MYNVNVNSGHLLRYKPINKNGFGMGISDGSGILTQPDKNKAVSSANNIKHRMLGLFSNLEVPARNLYNIASYKGFCQIFPGAL